MSSATNSKQPPAVNNGAYAFFLKYAPGAVIALTAIIYCKAIFYGYVVFDDDSFIYKNALVKDNSLHAIKAIFTSLNAGKYNPLTIFSYNLEYRLFGLNPLPMHLDNIVLHLLSTWLIFKIAELLSKSRITAIVVSLLFAIHPMHVEEVAWVSERKDTLYAFFYLFSWFTYLLYIKSGYKIKYFVFSFLLFVASLFAKSEAITLPFILFATDIYCSRKIDKRVLGEKFPFLVCSIIIAALSLISRHSGDLGKVTTESYGLINRFFLFISIPAFYLFKLVAPFHLSAMHYYPDMNHGMLPVVYYLSLPFLFLVILFIVRLTAMSASGGDMHFMRKQVIFGISFFLITICVMPQLVTVGPALTPERYTYIPYIGLFFIAGQWLSAVGLLQWKKVSVAVSVLLLWMFCMVTWLRIDVWKDSETLMTDMIEKNSDIADCSFLYWLRGNARMAQGDLPDAVSDYDVALSQRNGNYMEAFSNRGAAHYEEGNMPAAIHDYDSSIIDSPSHPKNYFNRASAKATIGDLKGAITDYDFFLKLSPENRQGYLYRGMAKLSLKDSAGACADWHRSLQLGDDSAKFFIQQICR